MRGDAYLRPRSVSANCKSLPASKVGIVVIVEPRAELKWVRDQPAVMNT